MAKKTIFTLECPQCGHSARAELDNFHRFLIYKCPQCHSNVVYYDKKVEIISSKMIRQLKKKGKLRLCGDALYPVVKPSLPISPKPITDETIANLRILLETTSSVESFLSKI